MPQPESGAHPFMSNINVGGVGPTKAFKINDQFQSTKNIADLARQQQETTTENKKRSTSHGAGSGNAKSSGVSQAKLMVKPD